jgi:hypothetical protein
LFVYFKYGARFKEKEINAFVAIVSFGFALLSFQLALAGCTRYA